MRIIVTRPRADAGSLAEKLEAQGHQCQIMPLLEIVPRQVTLDTSKRWQAICISSANGLVSVDVSATTTTPLFCVGPQSAMAAKAAGFVNVTARGGDVAGLAAHLHHALSPQAGPILYLSGAETSGDLEGKLKANGFDVTRLVTYDAVPVIPPNLKEVVSWAEAVLLYSPRTAKLWLAALAKSKCDADHILHFCLSANVAKNLPQSLATRVAATPDETAMLASLEH